MTDGEWCYLLVGEERELELLPGRTTVGRGTRCDIAFDDASVSRRHAALVPRGERLTIEDLGSRNGTWVGGRRISRRVELANGSLVRFGEIEVRVRIFTTAYDTVAVVAGG